MRQVNFVYYQPQDGHNIFSISELSFIDFFEIYGKPISGIKIKKFYGTDLFKDYEPKDVQHVTNLRQLAKYMSSKDHLVLNDLEFDIKGKEQMTINFNDDCDCTISSNSSAFLDIQLSPLIQHLCSDQTLVGNLKSNPGKYLVLGENCKLVASFETFDQYLSSEFGN